MDQLNERRQIIERVLLDYAGLPSAHDSVKVFPVFDRENDRYFVMVEGWRNKIRVHHCLLHVDIIDGKIWIQNDDTEEGVATDFERAGIPKSQIVLGFRRPEVRPYTEYAAA